jgi:hypothetical protein
MSQAIESKRARLILIAKKYGAPSPALSDAGEAIPSGWEKEKRIPFRGA